MKPVHTYTKKIGKLDNFTNNKKTPTTANNIFFCLIKKYKPNLIAITGKIEEISDFILKNTKTLENENYMDKQIFMVPGAPVTGFFQKRYVVAFFLNSISAVVDEFINSFNKKVGNRMKFKGQQ